MNPLQPIFIRVVTYRFLSVDPALVEDTALRSAFTPMVTGSPRVTVGKKLNIDGARFNQGDVGVCVRWFDRVELDAEGRTFTLGEAVGLVNVTSCRYVRPDLTVRTFAPPVTATRPRTRGQAAIAIAARPAVRKDEHVLLAVTERAILRAL